MITLDGKPLSTWGLKTYGSHKHPGTPEIRTNTMPIPGMEGEWDFGSRAGVRPFNHPLRFIERDLMQRQRNLREFVAFLCDPYGNPREVKLVYEYEPDKYYMVKFNNKIDPDRHYRHSTIELPLVANKPRARFIVPTTEITMGSDIVPIWSDVYWGTGGAEYQVTQPQTITMMNSGKAIRMSVIIQGSGTNVKLSANGTTMDLGTFSNSTIDIQGDEWNIFKDGKEELVTPYFIDLLPGENKVSITGSNLNFTITENMTYQYV